MFAQMADAQLHMPGCVLSVRLGGGSGVLYGNGNKCKRTPCDAAECSPTG